MLSQALLLPIADDSGGSSFSAEVALQYSQDAVWLDQITVQAG